MQFINNPQRLRIEKCEWYDHLQHDISPRFRPNENDSNFARALSYFERNGYPICFFNTHKSHLTDYSYWFFLGTIWIAHSEQAPTALWQELFSSQRPHRSACLMKPTELKYFRELPKEVSCYRAHSPAGDGFIAYTLDLDTVRKFASIKGIDTITEYLIPKKHLLALFLRRGEYEVLCLDKDKARFVKKYHAYPQHA